MMNNLTIAYGTIRSSFLFGFAGYGAAAAYEANRNLSAKVGVIYALATSIFHIYLLKSGESHDSRKYHAAYFGIQAMTILACRYLELIGTQGTAILAVVSLIQAAVTEFQLQTILAHKKKKETL